MPAISNSSPLILYARINRLELLRSLFGEVYVPSAVWQEVVDEARGRSGGTELPQAEWIRTVPAPPLDHLSIGKLDRGEAEAIALAATLEPPLPILLDDRRARRAAQSIGLIVIGTAGLLVRAKDAGLVPAVLPILDRLRTFGLYIDDSSVRDVLEEAGER